jgi:predicted nucleotidyltransferase
MKMLQGFREQEFLKKAVQLTLENVTFSKGFSYFLHTLEVEELAHNSTRMNTNTGYKWVDNLSMGGIQLETTQYPLDDKSVGTITFAGSKQQLEVLQSIIERHQVSYDGAPTPEDIDFKVEYHDKLNPTLWEDDQSLHHDVQEALEDVASAFFEFLDIPKLPVEDVVLTGSSANYNWTESSDLDVHLVVNMKAIEKKFGKLAINYFDAKKKVWNELHDIQIKGIPVELYVQDKDEVHNSTGIYSISEEEWVIEPKYEEPNVDDAAVKAKAAEWISAISDVTVACNKADIIEKFMQKLTKLRQAGLDNGGEFSTENLAFKVLRNGGYLDQLAECKTKAFDRELSIEEEEWVTLTHR